MLQEFAKVCTILKHLHKIFCKKVGGAYIPFHMCDVIRSHQHMMWRDWQKSDILCKWRCMLVQVYAGFCNIFYFIYCRFYLFFILYAQTGLNTAKHCQKTDSKMLDG